MAKQRNIGRVNRSQSKILRRSAQCRLGRSFSFGVEALEDRRLLAASPELVLDINTGTHSSSPGVITTINGISYFRADDGIHGHELWRSDGTEAGTMLVRDIAVGPGDSSPQPIGVLNDTLLFSARDSAGKESLWKTDGTEIGTFHIANVLAFSGVALGNTVIFAGWDPTNGIELWRTDGTTAGTTLIKDINPSGSAKVTELTVVGDDVFFVADDDVHGQELWKTDGSEVGTTLVKDIEPGAASSMDQFGGGFGFPAVSPTLVEFQESLFFAARTSDMGLELWKSDGTESGTQIVKDINPGPLNGLQFTPYDSGAYSTYSRPELVEVGGKLFFEGTTDSGYSQVFGTGGLWMTDGTEAGTMRVENGPEVSYSSNVSHLTQLNGELYFLSANESDTHELSDVWRTDGTAAGTAPFLTIGNPGVGSGFDRVATVNDLLIINGKDQLFTTDGTSAGTKLIANQNFTNLAVNGNQVFMSGYDFSVGHELFRYDPNGSNIAPVVKVAIPTNVVRGLDQIVTLTAADAFLDEQAGFTWHIDWDLDGTADETFTGGIEVTVTHTFYDGDSPTFQAWAIDQESAASDMVQTTVDIVAFDLIPDDVDPSLTNLVYSGTPGFDGVFFLPAGPNKVVIFTTFENSVPVYYFDVVNGVTGRLIAHTHDSPGGDVLVAEFLGMDVEFHGGDGADVLVGGLGNDTLIGGLGHDILLGGNAASDGGDLLQGGAGRDLLFGHLGADLLEGGSGEDLLVSDRVGFSDTPSAVYAIQAEWLSARDYATRVANLSGTGAGPRNNGSTFLTPGAAVFDDTASESLTGNSDLDWYLYSFFDDLVTDPETEEVETDLFGT